MIKYLNNSICKTKKLLLLIPMKILTSQVNIKSLLKLNLIILNIIITFLLLLNIFTFKDIDYVYIS